MVVHRASGFALMGGNFHVLRIHVVRVRNPQQRYRRGTLEAKRNTTELKERFKEQEGNHTFYQGSLRLGETDYKLASIIVMFENGATRNYTADIINQLDSVRVGNISVITRNYDNVRIGEGSLTMNNGNGSLVYRVLLTIDEG